MTVRLRDLAVADALLSVSWESVGVDRRLVVQTDGTVWGWSLAAAGPGSDLVGTFRLDADPDTVAGPADLALSVRASNEDPAGKLGFTVTAGAVTEWVAEGTPRAGEVAAVTGPLLDRLQGAPLAVARWVIAVRLPSSGDGRAVFSASAVGTETVCLRFDPDSLQLVRADGSILAVPAPRMGLVTPDVELLDGLYEPAVLAPGASGACAIALPGETAGAVGDPGPQARFGSLTGSVALPGPWSVGTSGTDPVLGFSVHADVHLLG